MPSMAGREGGNERNRLFLMIVGPEPADKGHWDETFQTRGLRVQWFVDPIAATTALSLDHPDILVLHDKLVEGSGFCVVRGAARDASIPILEVMDENEQSDALPEHCLESDDWVYSQQALAEIPARAARLHVRNMRSRNAAPEPGGTPLADARFFALLVHDLRTPLNVIGLSLRMVSQSMPKGDPDLDEDLRFIDENFKQIERMLTQLSDYSRLFDGESALAATEFSPRRVVAELIESRAVRLGAKGVSVRLEIAESCPQEVSLDPHRVQTALQYALTNAAAAAGDASVLVSTRGAADRWITEITIDRPAPSSVASMQLQAQAFERLCGTAAERRGMDLAIVARISELFHGSARIELSESRASKLILDWPSKLDSEPSQTQSSAVSQACRH